MKKNFFYHFLFVLFLLGTSRNVSAQTGFVHASGTSILDNEGKNLIFRGIGTGNWLLQEGYMMNTSGATNGTQWDFRRKLVNTIGEEKTQAFYNAWWDKHTAKKDVDAMAKWGFNSIRVAMHYKIFTLPIEQELVAGQDTWLEDGFVRMDSLLKWCTDNKMYLILDMHGCPGAQGDDSNISDYNPAYPSLWQSAENKRKLVALWTKLAQRYADSPWIGAYDIINEPKWTLPNNNKDLWDLQKEITLAIRTVDTHHLIFIEGNNWGNDYNGLPTTLWDNNMGMSFHKYWTTLGDNSIDGMINNGKSHNCPVWLGESGENSNSWFAELIRVCENHQVGWSWWPVKKTGNNNVLTAKGNTAKYNQLLTAWKNNTSINATTAFEGVMEFADGHAFDNCKINYDVIDAMITQPHTHLTRPFKNHTVASTIFAADYDLGKPGYAYYDKVDATYSNNPYTTYQSGGKYRNDGVDIESCSSDSPSNGYDVGWIEDGEWLKYTIESPAAKAYNVELRYASANGGGKVYLEINGERATKTLDLVSTGSWTTWRTGTFTNVVIPAGTVEVKVIFEKGGANFNYFRFVAEKEIAAIDFELLNAATDKTKDELTLLFNQPVSEIDKTAFAVSINGSPASVNNIKQDVNTPQKVIFSINEPLLQTNTIRITYSGTTCKSGEKPLLAFSNFNVTNNITQHFTIPVKIEAEDYADKNGFEFQTCTDEGGGQNAGYTVAGNYLDYIVFANYTGKHKISLRTAGASSGKRIEIYSAGNNILLATVNHIPTTGWQSWRTHHAEIHLQQGKNILRIQAATDGFNFNWLELAEIAGAGIADVAANSSILVYPNPVSDVLHIQSLLASDLELTLFDISGKQVFLSKDATEINVQSFPAGVYFLQVESTEGSETKKIVIRHSGI